VPKVYRAKGLGNVQRNGGIYHQLKDGSKKPEHVMIVERILGKKLPKRAVVHHWDRDQTNNKHENLLVCPNQAYHLLIHQRMRALESCGHVDWRKCQYCKQYDDPNNLNMGKRTTFHRECRNEYDRQRQTKMLGLPQKG